MVFVVLQTYASVVATKNQGNGKGCNQNIPCRYLLKVSERVGMVWRICGLRKSPKALQCKILPKFQGENSAKINAKERKYMQKEDNS